MDIGTAALVGTWLVGVWQVLDQLDSSDDDDGDGEPVLADDGATEAAPA